MAHTARETDYPTGNPNGMSFICNRWVFTGPQGYRVQPADDCNGNPAFRVVSYNAGGVSPIYGGTGLTEADAHELAATMARTTVHPAPEES